MNSSKMALTDKQQRFVEEYLIDLNATKAAIRAGYSAKTANEQGSRLLANVSVFAAVSAAQEERSKRTAITADQVLQELWAIASADTNGIVEYRRTCCRYCHGEGFRYQFTQGEMERHREGWEQMVAELSEGAGAAIPPLDEKGGIGFDPRRDPHPSCPECFGEGIGEVFVKDTRKLSPALRSLYGGAKLTKNGLEVKCKRRLPTTLSGGS
jgi:phage terminase small subunit